MWSITLLRSPTDANNSTTSPRQQRRARPATLGPQNIRVNAIAPGFANAAGPRKFYDRYPNIHADIDDHVHLKPSFLHPGAVLPAVMYLLSDNFITGQCLTMDGGYTNHTRRYFQGG